jgi:hypothetical protein
MFGLPIEILTMLMSTLGGAAMKMWSQSQADLADERNFRKEQFMNVEASMERAGKLRTPEASWAKKFLVVSFMAMAAYILVAPALGMSTVVPVEVTSGFKFLFLDFTNTVTEYISLEGTVVPEWLGHAIMAVVGLYFGQSITRR